MLSCCVAERVEEQRRGGDTNEGRSEFCVGRYEGVLPQISNEYAWAWCLDLARQEPWCRLTCAETDQKCGKLLPSLWFLL